MKIGNWNVIIGKECREKHNGYLKKNQIVIVCLVYVVNSNCKVKYIVFARATREKIHKNKQREVEKYDKIILVFVIKK